MISYCNWHAFPTGSKWSRATHGLWRNKRIFFGISKSFFGFLQAAGSCFCWWVQLYRQVKTNDTIDTSISILKVAEYKRLHYTCWCLMFYVKVVKTVQTQLQRLSKSKKVSEEHVLSLNAAGYLQFKKLLTLGWSHYVY